MIDADGDVSDGVTEDKGVASSDSTAGPIESAVSRKSDRGAGDPSASPRVALTDGSVAGAAPNATGKARDFDFTLPLPIVSFWALDWTTRGAGLKSIYLSIEIYIVRLCSGFFRPIFRHFQWMALQQ